MNEQELTDKAEAFVRDQGNTHSGLADRPRIICWMSSFAKAYADAQVDAAVGRAMNEVGRISVEYNTKLAAKDTEIAELKEKIHNYELRIDSNAEELDRRYAERSMLNAEIKRMKDGIASVMDRFNFPTEARDRLNGLLSPAPVTERKFSVSGYPKECVPTIEQLTETDDMTMVQRLEKRIPPFHKVAHVTEPPSGILQTILALPDDTSAAYIKSMIHDHTTGQ